MLLFGQFNYGKRGILDLTHTRLFTFAIVPAAVRAERLPSGASGACPRRFRSRWATASCARSLLKLNQALIAVWRRMFSYQMVMEVRPMPSLEFLLQSAFRESAARARHLPDVKAAE